MPYAPQRVLNHFYNLEKTDHTEQPKTVSSAVHQTTTRTIIKQYYHMYPPRFIMSEGFGFF